MSTINWSLDKAHSEIKFKAKHLMITTVTGAFENYDVSVESNGTDFADASITFEADIASINTNNTQRDEHLKSDDFFNAEAFPKLRFVSRSMASAGDGSTYTLTGDLTIRDVTRPVTLTVEKLGVVKDPWGNTKAGFAFSGKVNRKEFGLKFHVVNEAGDLLVSDDIKLEGEVQLLEEVTAPSEVA